MKRTLKLFGYGLAIGLFTALCAWSASKVAASWFGADAFNCGVIVGAVVVTAIDVARAGLRRLDKDVP